MNKLETKGTGRTHGTVKSSWRNDVEYDIVNLQKDNRYLLDEVKRLNEQIIILNQELNQPAINIIKKKIYGWLTSWMD